MTKMEVNGRSLHLLRPPSECTSVELALVFALSVHVATLADRLGIKPEDVTVTLSFGETGNKAEFSFADGLQ
ncbi:hypothetical protein LCGC14_1734850 [marine sediment metagenome]|uniref:Uncharacterized protein n=1 Tax=marine sediment metagenome TaxID=412755 RepID=A0A0F9K822_9ZZZZ